MTANIDPYSFESYWLIIITVISSLYVIMFLLVGFKFLFGSYDAQQRSEAKEWAKKAVLVVISVNASLLIYSLALNLSSVIAGALWSEEFEALFMVENLGVLDFLWLAFFSIAVLLAVITLVIRHIYLIVGVMLFPIGLFLNYIDPVKTYGSAILNTLGGAAFMNVLDVIVLIAVQLFWTEFNYLGIMNIMAPALGFLFIAIANTALFVLCLLKALNAVGIRIDTTTIVKTVAGAALA